MKGVKSGGETKMCFCDPLAQFKCKRDLLIFLYFSLLITLLLNIMSLHFLTLNPFFLLMMYDQCRYFLSAIFLKLD